MFVSTVDCELDSIFNTTEFLKTDSINPIRIGLQEHIGIGPGGDAHSNDGPVPTRRLNEG
eukprot:990180-Pyramimonas_sp.AAC.1